MKNLLLSAAVAAALSGCASSKPVASAEEVSAREYPTGSNIPRRAPAGSSVGVSTYDRDALERARDQMPQQPRPGLGGSP